MGLDVVRVMRTPIRIGDQLWGGGRSRENGGCGVVAEVFSNGSNVFADGLQLGVHALGKPIGERLIGGLKRRS
jgi:hypothetical protein